MAKRQPIIIGNWKMHNTIMESIRLVTELKGALSGKQETEVVVAPDAVSLHPICIALQDVKIGVAAQNMHWEEQGAFTGEVSANMLSEVGCTYVIVGHSERRQHFHETDQQVRLKAQAAIDHDLVPIVCLGESAEQRKNNETMAVIDRQLSEIFYGLDIHAGSDLIVAYEPVWAIGTGNNATAEQAQEVHARIRHKLGLMFRGDIAEQLRVVYGGSVKPENAAAFMKMADIDGLLVGAASLDAAVFANIVMYNELEENE